MIKLKKTRVILTKGLPKKVEDLEVRGQNGVGVSWSV